MWEPTHGSLESAGKRQESGTLLQRGFFNLALQLLVAAQLLVKMKSALQKSELCSATSALQRNFPKIAA